MKPTFKELLSLAEVCSTLPEFSDEAEDGMDYDDHARTAHAYLRHWWPDGNDEKVLDLCYRFWWYANAAYVAKFERDLLEAYNDLTQAQ